MDQPPISDRGHLLTETGNPASERLDTLSAEEIVEVMHREDQAALAAVRAEKQHIARAIELVTDAFRAGGRLFYVGAGTSGRLGVLDASECPPTFSTPPEMVQGIIAGGAPALQRSVERIEDDPRLGADEIARREVGEHDVVMGIATGGTTPFVHGALDEAKRRGARTVFFCCCQGISLSEQVDVAITPLVGPEVVTGSTRLKAGTATKLVLNMITTGAMVRLRKTYGNLMVDLRVLNNKLQDRAERIVMMACGVERCRATELLAQADGAVKTAIVMHLRGCSRDEAQRLLAAAGGWVRAVIEPG